ncbi:hypothetical protein CDAR_58671 [Caerostris darwini]|uniref:Uncharacterized protein n=1 Tax=Caerostris darwini TaxID=1538125 RepID=A0AAV4S4S1_9ARAC|nr:hypothetical protein CDAR_58671 [Caerostris darwini]
MQAMSAHQNLVHKELYCSTRHDPESADSSSFPTPTQQLQEQQRQNQQQHPTAVSNQPRFPGCNTTTNTTTTAVTSESESKGFNMVLYQPLYAAVSTSASILVPCSYVAGGGLSPITGFTPSANMITPNPSTTPESNSGSQGGNVIPTCTAMPGTGVAELNSGIWRIFEAKPMNTYEKKVEKHVPSKTPKVQSKEEAENPLDLSFKKRDVEFEKSIAPKSSTDTDNY